jgi:hypothetical protein
MTQYDKWDADELTIPQETFKGRLFRAYAEADIVERSALDRAFPEYFIEDPEASEAGAKQEMELTRLENLFGERIRKDSILAQLTQQREDRVKAICDNFLNGDAEGIADDFIEYMLDILDQSDDLSPDEEEVFDYFNTLYNGAK